MSEQNLDLLFNSIGITGISLIVLAYFLLQKGFMKSDKVLYPLVNLVGAILHLISLYRFYNLPSVIIEIFWIVISLYGILKALRTGKAKEI